MSAKKFHTIQHVITATNQFTGAASAGALTSPAGASSDGGADHTLYAYATDTAGGLFNPATNGTRGARLRTFERLTIKFGGQSAWQVDILDEANGTRVAKLFAGTTEVAFCTTEEDRFVLLPGEKLKLTTTGMTATGVACATFSDGGL